MVVQDVYERRITYDSKISGAKDAYTAMKRFWGKKQEHFLVMTLDGNHKPIKIHVVTIGLLNRTLIHPREVFRTAILDCAAGIIIAHNHPSSNLQPSTEDDQITRRLFDSGQLVGIPVLDHLIISKSGYYSYQEVGKLT